MKWVEYSPSSWELRPPERRAIIRDFGGKLVFLHLWDIDGPNIPDAWYPMVEARERGEAFVRGDEVANVATRSATDGTEYEVTLEWRTGPGESWTGIAGKANRSWVEQTARELGRP